MKCWNCGAEINPGAAYCLKCGAAVQRPAPAPAPRKKSAPWWIIPVVILGAFAAFVLFAFIMAQKPDPAPQQPAATVSATTESFLDAQSPYPYGPGIYQVGVDLPAGEYQVVAKAGKMVRVIISLDSSLEDRLCDPVFDTWGFITVSDGQYLKISNGRMIESESALVPSPNSKGIYRSGTYRVGLDIDPGTYAVLAEDGEDCYIEVASNSLHQTDSILYNHITDGSGFAIVSDGDYFTVERGIFKKAE